MFTKKILLVIASAVAVAACNVVNEPLTSYDDEIKDMGPNYVSMSLAVEVANNYIQDKGIIIPTRSNAVTVKNTFTVRDNDDSPILHAVNFDGGGFTLVSSDNRLQPVLGYSDEGEFSFSNYSSPLGLRIWVETIKNMIEDAKSKGEERDSGIAAMWQKFSSEPLGRLMTRSLTPGGEVPPEADTVVGPLITDSWHQYEPYNDAINPVLHYDGDNGTYVGPFKPAVGCVPLVIARLMRYHQYPTSFSWSSMPSDIPQTATTKSFINTIHSSVKTYAQNHSISFNYYYEYDSVSMSYVRITSTGSSFPLGYFLQSQYGYASGEDSVFSPTLYENIRRDMIDHHLPCFISGYSSNNPYTAQGHVWICDGYSYSCVYLNTPSDPDEEQEYLISTYLHHRWGMTTTSCDGWFSASNYNLNGLNYIYNMRLTRRISPIDYWPDE